MTYNTTPQVSYDKRVDQITDWLKGASSGSYTAQAALKEAVSTSDFPAVFTDIKTAQLQAKYALVDTQIWRKIARKVTVPNFLPQSFIDLGWDDSALDNLLVSNGGRRTAPGTLPNIPEGTEYPTAFKLYSSAEQLEIRKAGARVEFTFEAIINDQWNIVDDLPNWLLRVATDSEDAAITSVFVDIETGAGLNTSYFNAANNNLLKFGTNADGTAALTRDTLKAALKQANSHKAGPNENRPVKFSKFALVVPAALEDVAQEILDMPTTYLVTDGNLQYTDTFSFGARFEVVVDPWLDVINTVSGETNWFIVPFAGEGVRTSLALGFLNGYDRPELRVHNDTGLYLGGGQVPARQGSFRNDDWELRIRHIFGEVALNGGIGTVASTGTAAPTV